MVTTFPTPQSWCMAPVAARTTLLCSDRFATPHSRSRHPVSCPDPAPSFPPPLVPVPHPVFIPHRAPTTPWRGLIGPSSIRGPFCAPGTGRSNFLPSWNPRAGPLANLRPVSPCACSFLCPVPHSVFIPHSPATNPLPRTHWIHIHSGTVLYPLHGLLLSSRRPGIVGLGFWPTRAPCHLVPVLSCAPSLIPCLYHTGPPATQWRGPEEPFRAPCPNCSYSYPCFRALLALWLFSFRSFFPFCAPCWCPPPNTPSVCPLLCRVLWFFSVWFFLFFCFFYPPPGEMHARDCWTGRLLLRLLSGLISAPLAPVALSPWLSPAMSGGTPPVPLPLRAPRPTPPPVARLSPFPPLLLFAGPVCAAALLRATAVSFSPTRASRPAPDPPPGRPTSAACPATSLGGFPRPLSPPPSAPSAP